MGFAHAVYLANAPHLRELPVPQPAPLVAA